MSDLRRATVLMGGNQHAAALPLLQAALRRSEQKPGGPSSAETADVLCKIGGCYSALTDYPAAGEFYRRAAAISTYGFKARAFASLNAAYNFGCASNHTEAEKQINTSLSMIDIESAAGTTAPAVLKGQRAEALAISTRILYESGRYSETLPLYEENLAYYESIDDTLNFIGCLTGLGEIYVHQGLREKALAMARRAQSLNPSTVSSLGGLSNLFSRLGQHDQALLCSQKALECEECVHGKKKQLYADLLAQIGTEYSFLGQNDVALSWYHRARVAFEKLHLEYHLNFGGLMQNIGLACELTNNLFDALFYFTRAEAIFHVLLPPDHQTTALCMRHISRVNTKLGNTDVAAAAAAAAASSSRRSQVQCAGPDCPRKIKEDGAPLDQCGGCKRCYYCSKACQTAHWKAGHKAECKELRGGK